jgi:hypothetical protein
MQTPHKEKTSHTQTMNLDVFISSHRHKALQCTGRLGYITTGKWRDGGEPILELTLWAWPSYSRIAAFPFFLTFFLNGMHAVDDVCTKHAAGTLVGTLEPVRLTVSRFYGMLRVRHVAGSYSG